ncbi:YopX family protein [Capnocytophaga gingivalis]|uniref:YopX family protein n=1 Tax=Capnocytophaga gingivalis TaxID=1017 RepID=UPI0023525633|nr:YopX family protein [Capnocytophaga gingivalis]
MRTIKFRGFSNCNSQWTYGNLVIVDGEYHITDQEECEEVSDYTLVDENSVGQFTGLYDKNGNEIYENDILQLKIDGKEYNPLLVVYSEVYAGFCMLSENTLNNIIYKPHRPVNPNWWDEFKDEIEIIGNIYDNPELFKQ